MSDVSCPFGLASASVLDVPPGFPGRVDRPPPLVPVKVGEKRRSWSFDLRTLTSANSSSLSVLKHWISFEHCFLTSMHSWFTHVMTGERGIRLQLELHDCHISLVEGSYHHWCEVGCPQVREELHQCSSAGFHLHEHLLLKWEFRVRLTHVAVQVARNNCTRWLGRESFGYSLSPKPSGYHIRVSEVFTQSTPVSVYTRQAGIVACKTKNAFPVENACKC